MGDEKKTPKPGSSPTPSDQANPGALLTPTGLKRRIPVIDVLRGFALFGVLLINLIDLAGSGVSISEMTGGRNPGDAFATQFFIAARFRAIFGMLFGMGVALQIQRASEKGKPFLGFFSRRMVILAAFGMLNFLFYRGDILTRYALVGMVLVPFYRLPVRRIFLAAILILLAHALVPFAVQSEAGPRAWVAGVRGTLSLLPPTDQACQSLRDTIVGNYYTAGTFWQVRMVEACRFPQEATNWIHRNLLQTLLFFLVGLGIGKARLFSRISELRTGIIRGSFAAAAIGFPLIATRYLFPDDPGAWTEVTERLVSTSGITLTALAYCGVLALAFQTRLGTRLLSPLAAIGRMALTVYIGQHLIAAALFQGWGLGWSHRPEVMSMLVPLVFGLYFAEVVLCNVWLRYFRFGPLEWLWRSTTYRRLQPILRVNTA